MRNLNVALRATYRMLRRIAICVICGTALLTAAPAFAQADGHNMASSQSVIMTFAERYPAGSIVSSALADQALQDVQYERERIQTSVIDDERACLADFFMTPCLNEARERRRIALESVRTVKAEANKYRRQLRSEERDAAVLARKSALEASARLRIDTAQVPPVIPLKDGDTNDAVNADNRSRPGSSNRSRPGNSPGADELRKRAMNANTYAEKARASMAGQQAIAVRKESVSQNRSCPAPCRLQR